MNSLLIPSDAVIHALGWTLLHSLWQGVALALLVWLVRTRLTSPEQRYWLSYTALISQFGVAVLTFFWYYQPELVAGANDTVLLWHGGQWENQSAMIVAEPQTWTDVLSSRLEAIHPFLVGLWGCGFVLLMLRLAGSWWWLEQLRRNAFLLEGACANSLRGLLERTRTLRPVQLMQSASISSPMTIGFFKPVILFPVALVNQITTEAAEAIIAHELAHIVRHDWLFNMLQAFIETVFYYHPAAWWLSATARQERENCCDDYAVSLTGQRLQYARVLLQVQELSQKNPVPALSLGLMGRLPFLRKRPALLLRIQRLLQPQQQKIELMEKWIATAIIMALVALWGVKSGGNPMFSSLQAMVLQPFVQDEGVLDAATYSISDSVPTPKRIQKVIRDDGNQKVEMEMENGAIKHLNIDGKEIPASDYGKYEELTTELMNVEAPPPPPPPAAPPAPGMIWETPAPPGAPRAPTMISSDKDGQGNTMIRIERSGEPVEIVVRDGAVIMNGKTLKDGEALVMPGGDEGMVWNSDDRRIVIKGGDHDVMFFSDDAGTEVAPRVRFFDEQQDRALDGQRMALEMQRNANDQQRIIVKEMRIRDNELQKMHKDQEHLRRNIEVQIEQDNDSQHMQWNQQDGDVFQLGQGRAFHFSTGGNFDQELRDQLSSDGFIGRGGKFDFRLTEGTLKINGKKQSSDLHRKYMGLYSRHFGHAMGPKETIRIVE